MVRKRSIKVSDVIRLGLTESVSSLSFAKRKVVEAILACRTEKLGGHITECTACGHREQSYNSCWNRHCPDCQGGRAFQWVAKRAEELLAVSYYHVVFTIPSEFRKLCYANKKIIFDIIFEASAESMQDAAMSRYGVQLGFFGVLHTWNQVMEFHPHPHYAVPAGGITKEGEWKSFPGGSRFFLPVRVLSKLYRGKFISLLKSRYSELYLEGELSHLKNPREFEHLISKAAAKDWVVYAKRPFGSAEIVLKYLSSYTHRVGISSKRLRSLTKTEISFSARALKPGKKRIVTLTVKEFTKRFLLHTLPHKYRRIRYFGFLNNGQRAKTVQKIQNQLGKAPLEKPKPDKTKTCAKCKSNSLTLIAILKPHRASFRDGTNPWAHRFTQTYATDPPGHSC